MLYYHLQFTKLLLYNQSVSIQFVCQVLHGGHIRRFVQNEINNIWKRVFVVNVWYFVQSFMKKFYKLPCNVKKLLKLILGSRNNVNDEVSCWSEI